MFFLFLLSVIVSAVDVTMVGTLTKGDFESYALADHVCSSFVFQATRKMEVSLSVYNAVVRRWAAVDLLTYTHCCSSSCTVGVTATADGESNLTLQVLDERGRQSPSTPWGQGGVGWEFVGAFLVAGVVLILVSLWCLSCGQSSLQWDMRSIKRRIRKGHKTLQRLAD